MNGGAGTGAVDFFHGFQVALMLTVMFNLTQFVYWRCKLSRRGSCWQQYQPAFWTLMSTFMVNFQPLYILMMGSWHLCCADCATFFPNVTDVDGSCSSTGMTYPPWPNTPNAARACDTSGNLFWDKSYCSGKKNTNLPDQGFWLDSSSLLDMGRLRVHVHWSDAGYTASQKACKAMAGNPQWPINQLFCKAPPCQLDLVVCSVV